MKKIGIVTMVGVDNYGNLLQNYAVKKLIEDSGFKAVTLNNNIIEYVKVNEVKTKDKLKPSYILNYIKVVLFKKFGCKNSKDFTPQGVLSRIFSFKKYSAKKRNRIKKLSAFRNEFLPFDSAVVNTEAFHQEEYFAFVCGSDVVWHPTFHHDKSNDFLAFAPKHKRIALAPSFGVSRIPEGRIADYKKWIEGIEHLSVRENTGAQIIKELTDRDAKVLSDPTLSVDVESWRDIQQAPKDKPEEDFVFCYFLGNRTKSYEKFIIQYAKEHHCKIINVLDAADLDHYDVGLGEFLWFIDNAKAVFTDSFHGVVFSAIFHSPFVAFKRVERGLELFSRISSFLSDIKLENRVYPLISFEEIGNIDFDFSDEVIEKKRLLTKDFLSNAISNIETEEKE